ncbi:MAG: hypothetical protein KAJ58_00455 [Candidatus Pacebacteria bacterium]|nr:hypothetical protein [Candidatus Paceibacterota bacterium]
MKNKKIIISLILIVFSGGYFYFQKSTILEKELSVNILNTDNWETYATQNIQFKYPDSMYVKESTFNTSQQNNLHEIKIVSKNEPMHLSYTKNYSGGDNSYLTNSKNNNNIQYFSKNLNSNNTFYIRKEERLDYILENTITLFKKISSTEYLHLSRQMPFSKTPETWKNYLETNESKNFYSILEEMELILNSIKIITTENSSVNNYTHTNDWNTYVVNNVVNEPTNTNYKNLVFNYPKKFYYIDNIHFSDDMTGKGILITLNPKTEPIRLTISKPSKFPKYTNTDQYYLTQLNSHHQYTTKDTVKWGPTTIQTTELVDKNIPSIKKEVHSLRAARKTNEELWQTIMLFSVTKDPLTIKFKEDFGKINNSPRNNFFDKKIDILNEWENYLKTTAKSDLLREVFVIKTMEKIRDSIEFIN